jgi:protein-arginine kinase activator protein McsA
MADEKPLEKMTVKELKELALSMGTLQGVSAMKKQELIDAIKLERGIPVKARREKSPATIVQMKREIRSLRNVLTDVREAGDKTAAALTRKTISKLKKKTRRMARLIS